MKAIVCAKYGPPEVLELREVEKPSPKENEVLVKVYATTVNRTDCATLRAKPFFARFFTGLIKPKRTILGTDFAGIIEAIGNDVRTFKVGNKVFGLDVNGLSSHAQFLTFCETNAITTIPENITFQQAVASLEGVHYARNFINKVKLKPDHEVLVNGATGAIGSAAVQLVKDYGANVTAVCGTENIDLVKSLGADMVIDYLKNDFTNESQQYDFVFDTVGKSSFGKCKPILKVGGVYISSELGWMAQNVFFALFKSITGNKKVIFPIPTDINESVNLIKKMLVEETFKPVIDRNYQFEEIVEAFKYVESGKKIGNVIINYSN